MPKPSCFGTEYILNQPRRSKQIVLTLLSGFWEQHLQLCNPVPVSLRPTWIPQQLSLTRLSQAILDEASHFAVVLPNHQGH